MRFESVPMICPLCSAEMKEVLSYDIFICRCKLQYVKGWSVNDSERVYYYLNGDFLSENEFQRYKKLKAFL